MPHGFNPGKRARLDGQSRSIDNERHMQRFTPRKSRRWSAVNLALVAELEAEGRMTEAGRRVFAARDASEEPYSTSKRPSQLPPEFDERLRRDHPNAAAFWDSTPPSWANASKQPTRSRRFGTLHKGRTRVATRCPHSHVGARDMCGCRRAQPQPPT